MQTLPFSLDRSASATALAVTLCENRRDKLDLFADGISLTAQVGGSDTLPFFRDLTRATLDLASHAKARVILRCMGTGPWELGLERAGEVVLVSVYRAAASPEIFVFERPVPGCALLAGVVEGIANHLTGPSLPSSSARPELEALQRELLAADWQEGGEPADIEVSRLGPERDAQVGFASELALRVEARDGTSPSPSVERRELLPLLFRGSLGVVQHGRTRDVGQAFLFLVAEQLVSLSSELLEAWEQGRALHRRVESSGIILGARLYSPRAEMPPGDRALFLTLGGPRTSGLRDAFTCGLDEVPALGKAAVRFARGVLRAVLRARPSTAKNLRLILLREQLIELDDRLREATLDDSLVNRAPDTYRDFAAKTAQRPKDAGPSPAKIRYAARWMATIPGIELSSTFLCGDRLVVGAARETACLDRSTGDVIWRQPTLRAVSVVTPAGIARIHADGGIAVHDFATGDITLNARITPRRTGASAGAVVNAPGLPRLLIVTEGKRHLSAIDLSTGDVSWRHAARRGETFRLRRAGRLLIVVAGDAALTALDVTSGEIVWRTRDRLRFGMQVGLDHESLFAVAGTGVARARGMHRLHHVDPYAGTTRWVHDFPDRVVPAGPPLLASDAVIVPTRDAQGLGLYALVRATGEPLWNLSPGQVPYRTEWLVVDNVLVQNTEAGELAGLCTRTGNVLYRHQFARALEGDQPRRLEPVLRSGALYVPQSDVHVVRPRDGALLGRITGDVIPDLLRVDERCDVYLAEESGHIAAYRAGPRLSLV